MKQSKTYKSLSFILSLTAVLFMSVGVHLEHPFVHELHGHGASIHHHSHAHETAPAVIETQEECDICSFLANLKVGESHLNIDEEIALPAGEVETSGFRIPEKVYRFFPESRPPPVHL